MENYYVDGVEMHFFDGSVVPLDPSAEIVLHTISKEYLQAYIGFNGRVRRGVTMDGFKKTNIVISPGNPALMAAQANLECSYHGQPLPKTIEAKPRGSQGYELFDEPLVSGFDVHKVPTNAKGILATLSGGRKAMVDGNQTIVFYNCKPELVSSRMAEYKRTGSSWSNPVVETLPYDGSLGLTDRLNGLLMSGAVSAVQIKFTGNGSQLIYPASYFSRFSLV